MEYWHLQKPGGIAASILETVDAIQNDDEARIGNYRRWSSQYLERQVTGFEPGEWNLFGSDMEEAEEQLDDDVAVTWNVTRACVDAVVAKLTTRQIDPWVQTYDASESLQQRARLQEQFYRAVLHSDNAAKSTRKSLKLATICGTGPIKVRWHGNRILIDWLFPSRVIVDNNAALRGRPRSMFHEEFYERAELLDIYEGNKRAQAMIRDAQTMNTGTKSIKREMVRVIEATRLAQGKTKGTRAVVVHTGAGNGLLEQSVWPYERFAIEAMRWQEDLLGWYGLSGVECIERVQNGLDFCLEMIHGNLSHFGHPFLWKEIGSSIKDSDVETNERYKIIEGTGTPPTVITPPVINDQVFMWANLLWDRAFELFGLSQMTATSEKPPGLRSGTALRTYHDIESERFSEVARQRERLYVGLAWQIARCAKEMAAKGIDPIVTIGAEEGLAKQLKWSDVSLDENQFRIAVYPASALPSSPAGRRAEVTEMMESGIVDRSEARELLDMPDLAKWNKLVNAAREDIQNTCEFILSEDGEYVEPLPWQDLELGLQLGTSYYLRARMAKVPEERVHRLETWLQAVHAMLSGASELEEPPQPQPAIPEQLPADPAAAQQLAQAAATMPGPGPAGPVGPPMPTEPGV